jgi:hypothetical protein
MIIKNLLHKLGIKKLKEKDPKDYTLTWNSTEWSTGRYCPKCKNWIYHSEFMSGVCNSCGSVFHSCLAFNYKSVRQIYSGGKWIWQVKYDADNFIIAE